ncbi:uncharacterized protein LOC106138704 isoform X1 [Amyelois transitella]|uniref:uncharacterized protein LOC106138704 isoform X1 n=1 Tax=Amyelois transitella TaxID=680683 RepID=UPI00298FC19F|nr:uncharacterized protein LOC106138704 isoform X1 [Amyelois transitella]
MLKFFLLMMSFKHYSESLRIFPRPVYHLTAPSRLQVYKCRVLHRCGDLVDLEDLSGQEYYDKNNNLRMVHHYVTKDTIDALINPYFETTSKPATDNFFYNSIPLNSHLGNHFIFNHPTYDVNNYRSSSPKYDPTPMSVSSLTKLKEIVTNKVKIASRIWNAKHRYFESDIPSSFAKNEIDTLGAINKSNVPSHIFNTEKNLFESESSAIPDTEIDSSVDKEAKHYLESHISDNTTNISLAHSQRLLLNEFKIGLDKLERQFYMVTFNKLKNMTAGGSRAENAISFVQSALFVQLILLAVSIDSDNDVKMKIDNCIGIRTHISDAERIQLIDDVVSSLPTASHGLVFRWSSHLVLGRNYNVSDAFRNGAAVALRLHLDQFNGTESPKILSEILNRMVEEDSNGAIHNTFEPEDLSGTISAVFLTTLYLRSRWRTAPTVLNGSRIFRDAYEDPDRTIRMIRINDMMRYANLIDCDAEAIEVFYGKPGLSVLILVPRGPSLRRLAAYVAEVGLPLITGAMRNVRVAADLPLYTLRMSLLLPNKLEGLGLSDLLHTDNTTDSHLRMSHGLQRLMFWAEAGRTAFKDDGIEWDDPPHMRIVVDRPYLFFVRWYNMTLMNGNFVL